jgi:hypothetical protein
MHPISLDSHMSEPETSEAMDRAARPAGRSPEVVAR